MIKGQLISALDFEDRRGVTPGAFSWRYSGTWRVTTRSPKHENTYLVAEYDATGLAWLLAFERTLERTQTEGGDT